LQRIVSFSFLYRHLLIVSLFLKKRIALFVFFYYLITRLCNYYVISLSGNKKYPDLGGVLKL
jgi:hypothetical protein